MANYQEFQKNVSLKLLQESPPGQMTELKLLTSQKVKSSPVIICFYSAHSLYKYYVHFLDFWSTVGAGAGPIIVL